MESQFELIEILRSMGITDAFNDVLADFSGICQPNPNEPGLFIGDVIHKTFLEVDEEGTRAAASTAAMAAAGCFEPRKPPPLVMNVDHPFLITISAHSHIYRASPILFMGRVMDPTR
jgi:serpin B